jgi:hypothetical protein
MSSDRGVNYRSIALGKYGIVGTIGLPISTIRTYRKTRGINSTGLAIFPDYFPWPLAQRRPREPSNRPFEPFRILPVGQKP